MKYVGFLFLLMGASAQANGVLAGAGVAGKIAKALGQRTVTCESGDDHVTLRVDAKGDLRMVAHYDGAISGDLDTDDEGDGEECGGLTAKTSAKYSTYVLDDSYDDCERGDWGFRLAVPQGALATIAEHRGEFPAHGYAQVDGSKDGRLFTFACSIR